MTVASPSRAGEFGHSRRGGLTTPELREIEAHRMRERPTPWQALARRYGRPEAELRALVDPKPAEAPAEEPWPFLPAPTAVEQVARALARHDRMTLKRVKEAGRTDLPAVRLMAKICATLEDAGLATTPQLASIFDRNNDTIRKQINAHKARIATGDQ